MGTDTKKYEMSRHCCLGKTQASLIRGPHFQTMFLIYVFLSQKKKNTYIFISLHGEISPYVDAVALHRSMKGENSEGLCSYR